MNDLTKVFEYDHVAQLNQTVPWLRYTPLISAFAPIGNGSDKEVEVNLACMEIVDSDDFSSGPASNGSRTDDQQGAASALEVDSIVVVLLVSAWVVALGSLRWSSANIRYCFFWPTFASQPNAMIFHIWFTRTVLSTFTFAAATISERTFDYVIIGGGTAGNVLANRLSENSSVSVALIEAGGSALDNPLVRTIYGNCPACDTPLDWNYTTIPQQHLNGSVKPYHAGRCLGGTSDLNGWTYLRPAMAEFRSWQAVGNPGWSWESLLHYFRKSENLQIPPASQQDQGATYIAKYHGFDGPLDIAWPPRLDVGSYGRALNQTWQSLGLEWNPDANSGLPRGLFLKPSEYNLQQGGIREDANRAYLAPIANRTNLRIFTYTIATKIRLEHRTKSRDVVATGVDVITASGENQTIRADREIVLSLGTLRTPTLLEASGIGNSRQVEAESNPVDLPGVGYHLQDQIGSVLVFNVTGNNNSTDDLTNKPTYAFVTAADLFKNDTLSMAAELRRNIPEYAAKIAAESNGATTIHTEMQRLNARVHSIFDENVPIGELILNPTFVSFWQTLPLSIGSLSPQHPSRPLINPNYLQFDFDFRVQVALVEFCRRLYSSPPLSTLHNPVEISPGYTILPLNATDAQYRAFSNSSATPVWHGVGTAAMMSRELGGVIDSQMIVYGTSNVRVVDASAIPFEVNGHPTSTIYAMAEKAADLIKMRWD
ncbi:alcohol oxidase, partial [Aureobasidium melanogenum]